MRWTEWFGWIWGIIAKSVACGSSLARKALAAEDHQSRAPAVYFHLSAPPAGAAHGHLGPPADSAQGYYRSPRTTFGQLGFGFDSLKSHQFHKPPDISDKIQTMDIQMFFLEMSLISLSALHNLNWAQLIADSSLKWSHIFFPTKTPSQRVHLIKEFPPNDFEHRHLSPTFSHYLASQSFTTLDSQARLSYAVSAFRCSPAFSDLSCREAPIEINLEQIQWFVCTFLRSVHWQSVK